VFCRCGVEGSYERLWHPETVERERFKSLLKNVVRALESKGVSLRTKETMAYALSHFDDEGDADVALATAIDAGVVAAAASDNDTAAP